jgi:dTDP-4-amino-4,6-dideoxygalactose transaminase
MTAMLADIRPGDEIILPSFAYVTSANAYVLRGAIPVFIDIRPDTLNIDETAIEQAITPRTKAILVIHYGGVACEMEPIIHIAERHNLILIEDSAHAVMSAYRDKPLGSFGNMAAISFHETKNIQCGEAGALLINDPKLIDRAEIIWDKGTNRKQFDTGEVGAYSWIDIGSSFRPNELTAAFLFAQLEQAEDITAKRREIWRYYHQAFADLEASGEIRRPVVPERCYHNGHIYYLLLRDCESRNELIKSLRSACIHAVFHYMPLHLSRAGQKYGRRAGSLENTVKASESLIRLPLWPDISREQLDRVIDAVHRFFA